MIRPRARRSWATSSGSLPRLEAIGHSPRARLGSVTNGAPPRRSVPPRPSPATLARPRIDERAMAVSPPAVLACQRRGPLPLHEASRAEVAQRFVDGRAAARPAVAPTSRQGRRWPRARGPSSIPSSGDDEARARRGAKEVASVYSARPRGREWERAEAALHVGLEDAEDRRRDAADVFDFPPRRPARHRDSRSAGGSPPAFVREGQLATAAWGSAAARARERRR